ncbi:MAG: hypothetical protein L3K18_00505 [Thermoplasmata archaeon]|nr:hypothetical protein [Thermoplasmata archaeon]MCI4355611.1 hypothetical protein [Thermoplasmata archaeon]
MDGRLLTVALTIVLPAILLAVTVWQFASNPLSILFLVLVMIGGSLYLLTYPESFGESSTA